MKSLKNLLIPAIVLVALIIASVLWFALKPGGDEEVVEEETSIQVVFVSAADIKALNVHKRVGNDIRFESTTSDEGSITWTLIDDDPSNDEAALSVNTINSYISVLSTIYANSVITEPSALSDYGLDDPEYTVTFELNDGSVKTIYFGNTTYDSGNCYFMVEGDSNVYTCLTIKRIYAAYNYIDFLSSQLVNIAFDNIATVSFDRTLDDTHFTATCEINETGAPVYTCVEPYQIQTSTYFESLVSKIVNLEISGFVDISDDQLSEYGLDEPAFTFTFVLKTGETVVIELSQNLNGSFYGRYSGVDEYFEVSSMQISGLETPILTLLNSYIHYFSASEISSISGSYGDQSFNYVIDVESAINDADGSVMLNGRNALVTNSEGRRSYAAILYESLICIDVGGIEVDANPTYEPVLNFTYVTKDYQSISVDYVQRSTDSYYVFINGEYSCFYVYSRELFRDGGTDTFSYGAWSAYELCETAIDNQLNGMYDIPEEG